MDAVEFLKAFERRRNYKRGPNDGHCNWAFIYFDHRSHEELVAEVEHWYNGCVLSGFVIKANKIEAWNRRADNG